MDTYLWEYPHDALRADMYDAPALKPRSGGSLASNSGGAGSKQASKAFHGPRHEAGTAGRLNLHGTLHSGLLGYHSLCLPHLMVCGPPSRAVLQSESQLGLSEQQGGTAHQSGPCAYGGDLGLLLVSPRPPQAVASLVAHTLTPTERLLKLLGHLSEGPRSGSGSGAGATLWPGPTDSTAPRHS